MENNNKALITNVVALVIFILLLNTDSLIIKDGTTLIVFRASYIAVYLVLFVYSIIESQKAGYITNIFNPIIKRKSELPDNHKTLIVISIVIIMILIFALAFFILIYVY